MKELDVKNFEQEVIAESHKVPIVVDFWAPWCGPCKILGPILEKLASKASGRWLLKKVNVDENQDTASEYQVRGIPSVKLFRNGNPVAEFVGALPEVQVAKWLKNNLPSENDEIAEQALLFLETGNVEKARNIWDTVLKNEPNHSLAAFFLGRELLFEDPDEAIRLLSISEKDASFLTESEYLKKLALVIKSKDTLEAFSDHPVRPILMSAIKALSARDFSKAIEHFIEVILKDKAYENEIAREIGVALFYFLGPDHEITGKYRRKFDMALY